MREWSTIMKKKWNESQLKQSVLKKQLVPGKLDYD
jgi:hypothetical protein